MSSNQYGSIRSTTSFRHSAFGITSGGSDAYRSSVFGFVGLSSAIGSGGTS